MLALIAYSIAAVMLVIVALALTCIMVGGFGQWLARRHGQQCPHCDYRPPRLTSDADMLIHRVLEHRE